jgi:predicted TIM-barrel fold metal-dependent hydrolase
MNTSHDHPLQIVDTHAHVYHPDEARYPKIANALRPPERTGDIDHLRRDMRSAGVARAVLVQTGTAYGWDNRLLADAALANAGWAVGVCTLDPAAEASAAELERLAVGYNVRGLRMEPTRSGQPAFDHPGADRLWAAARRLGVVICAHVRSPFLGQLAQLLSRYPDVPVVLDHAAYPQAAEGVDSETVTQVAALARFPKLHLKLTFAVTGSEGAYPFEDMHAILMRLIEAYGPDRCTWGSDFPCELWLRGKATYQTHLALFTEALNLSEDERRAILEETAMRLWFSVS